MKVLPTLTILLLIAQSLFGQNDSALIEIARQHLYQINHENSFQGEGWEKIISAAQKHKYFLIGEDHGMAEIPSFTRALIEHINYELFVTEIDSITASVAQEISRSGEAQIRKFHERYPSALSFFSAKEEFEILTALARNKATIWGLDQVSLFSTGIVFRQLEKASTSGSAKELAASFAKLSDDLFTEATTSGNLDTLFIFSTEPAVFEELQVAFKDESAAARQILKDIYTSWKIYNQIDGANHSTRIGYMKSKLLNSYIHQHFKKQQYAKVLYKFGAYHVGKGESVIGGYEIGNFVANLAHAEGTSSYHLMVVGKEGEKNTFLPIDGMQKAPFDMKEKGSGLSSLIPLENLVSKDAWAFFDLQSIQRELRKRNIEMQGSLLANALNGYDGLIIIPQVTASKN